MSKDSYDWYISHWEKGCVAAEAERIEQTKAQRLFGRVGALHVVQELVC